MTKNRKPLFTIVNTHSNGDVWGYSIPLNAATVLHTVNGVRMLTTTRNYYLDTKQDKVRFQNMSTKGSSAKFYADVYPEVYPGLFARLGICTDNNLTEKLEAAAVCAGHFNLPEREDTATAWRESIRLMN